jgi:bifunctional ADP-heptose synthase (sugar kinase/adenylyltransferase)
MNILVIGEFCIDEFVYGECARLNPEAPTPVFIPKKTNTNPGMAGNVMYNLVSLGLEPRFVHNEENIKKTRYVDEKSNYILLRVDSGDVVKPITAKSIMTIPFEEYDAVIISDYNKGFLTEEILEYILVNSHLSFIDTKKPFGSWITNATYIKINDTEFKNPSHNQTVLDKVKHKLIITRGGEGCDLNGMNYPTRKAEIRDVVGAGDTFISALTAAYLKTNDIAVSILFANECATHVIQKRGVGDLHDMKSYFNKL